MNEPRTDRWALLLYAVAASLAIAAASSLFLGEYALPNVVLACRLSGYGALSYLMLSLSAAPLLRIANWAGWEFGTSGSWNRHGGRCAALLALVHGGVAIVAYLDFDWLALWQVTYLRSGFIAAIILLALLLTSSSRFNRLVGWQLFKPLHRLIYVAAALVLHHLLLSPFASRWWTLLIFGVLGGLLIVRATPSPRSTSTDRLADS